MDTIIKLAKKIKALADRGVDGEKINAELMLQRLMKKHNITAQEIEGESVSFESFPFKTGQDQILHQVMYMVIGHGLKLYGHRRKRNAYVAECSKSQYIEIQAAFGFYWSLYAENLKRFTKAFVYQNNLVPPGSPPPSYSEMTMSELEEMEKTIRMMKTIDKGTFRKQLIPK